MNYTYMENWIELNRIYFILLVWIKLLKFQMIDPILVVLNFCCQIAIIERFQIVVKIHCLFIYFHRFGMAVRQFNQCYELLRMPNISFSNKWRSIFELNKENSLNAYVKCQTHLGMFSNIFPKKCWTKDYYFFTTLNSLIFIVIITVGANRGLIRGS